MSYNGIMSEAMYYVLLALSNPTYGYKLMNGAIAEVYHERVSMGYVTFYLILTRLQKKGLSR